jgi:hypothetical protein
MGDIRALVNPAMPAAMLRAAGKALGCRIAGVPVETSQQERFALLDHPDVVASALGREIFCCPCLRENILQSARACGYETVRGRRKLAERYPGEAAYNCLIVEGRFLLHRTSVTDDLIKEAALARGMKLINVRQGYARCSVIPVTGNDFVTADGGVARALSGEGCRVCLVRGGSVRLRGHPYGFLGGASAVTKKSVLFFGSLAAHPDGARIKSFIEETGKTAVSLSEDVLEDFGGMVFFEQN